MQPIVIVGHGAGKLRSVKNAFDYLGHPTVTSADPRDVIDALGIVLPGQGACPTAMARLNETGMASAIRMAIQAGKPFFGVCLGLQLLFEWSNEGDIPCLGIIPGVVEKLPPILKIPHMGWNSVEFQRAHSVFADTPTDNSFYFVHSYYVKPTDQTWAIATTTYGAEFCSVAGKDNIVATQFHPEKSGPRGLKLYDNFVRQMINGKAFDLKDSLFDKDEPS